MEIDDLPAPGCLVQPVHILGEQHSAATAGLEPSQSKMGVIGLRLSKATRADHASGPIAAAGGIVGHERKRTGGVRFQLPAASR